MASCGCVEYNRCCPEWIQFYPLIPFGKERKKETKHHSRPSVICVLGGGGGVRSRRGYGYLRLDKRKLEHYLLNLEFTTIQLHRCRTA
jgi:hypothetical protein